MNVGIEATSICRAEHTGIQKYIVNLLGSLDALVGTREDVRARVLYRLSRWRRRALRPRFQNLPGRWYVGSSIPLLGRFDVVHALDMRLPLSRARNVLTIYDLAVLREEHQFPGYSTPSFRESRVRKYRAFLERTQAVVAISQTTKSDILNLFDFQAERIHVIHPGLAEAHARFDAGRDLDEARLRDFGLRPKSYFLAVGALNERKNTRRIIRAFLDSRASRDFVLVLAGQADSLPAEIGEALREGQERGSVRVLGYVNDDDLVHLYAGSAALLFPTIYEGFGLPILEAMSCLTPVVAANRGAAPEVCGGHGVLVDPFSVESIRDGIDSVLKVSGPGLLSARAHARSFTSERAAREMLDLYRKVHSE